MSPTEALPRMLVNIYPPDQGLMKPVPGAVWKTGSPDTRMMTLLHATGVPLGLVTNGEKWLLVAAKAGETTSYITWDAGLWSEEPLTLQAFISLLGIARFFGVAESETLPNMLAESALNQQEVTDQLGQQVLKAVEVLIQSLDRIDVEQHGRFLDGIGEKDLYQAALTVMMRLVFLFSAEERGLLLLGDALYDRHYAISTLRDQLRDVPDEQLLEHRHDAWSRFLATCRVIYGGVDHEAMRLPAYGGALFDPDRYPFLEGRKAGTSWADTSAVPLPINNRTVLHLLEALQLLRVRVLGGGVEPRRLSFRALDIEQIGHVYEGLLDHTAKRASSPVLGFKASGGDDIREQRSRLEVGSNALAPSLEQMGEQAEGWLESLRGLPESMRGEGVQLELWLVDLLTSAPSLAEQARDIAEKLRQSELEMLSELSLAEATIKELRNRETLRAYISPLKDEEWAYTAATAGELLERAEKRATEHRQTQSSLDRVTVALGELATAARSWANLEREIERQSLAIGSKEKRVEAEKLIIEAERTLKRATGKDSVFSMTSAIDEAQLRELLRSLNRLLARFHFPSDFLPIQLQIVSKSAKVPNYRFVSARGPEYAGLSTGQKTQLAVCWTVCLSYALRDRITHPIVAFDDFTTALDMGQLIPASGILRQLAYCESDEYRRQVIVTSHHEDLTNRLLDYLLPPKGRTMKVIEMLEWTPESGPEMQAYDVKPAVQQASPGELAGWLNAQLQGRPA